MFKKDSIMFSHINNLANKFHKPLPVFKIEGLVVQPKAFDWHAGTGGRGWILTQAANAVCLFLPTFKM